MFSFSCRVLKYEFDQNEDVSKLIRRNIQGNFDTGLGTDVFGYDPKSTDNKSKNRQMGLHQTKKRLRSTGNQQSEEATME